MIKKIINILSIAWVLSNYTFNKSLGTIYTNNTNTNIVYGQYAFNSEDKNQTLENKLTTKTNTITSTQFDNTNHEITVQLLSFTYLENNSNQCQVDITINGTIDNKNLPNLKSLSVAQNKLVQVNGANVNAIKLQTNQRYTNPYSIRDQINQIYTNIGNTGNGWDENDYTITKTQYPNTFYEEVEDSLQPYENDTTNFYIETNDPETIGYATYIKMVYTMQGTYQELTETTRQLYIHTYDNYKQNISYEVKVEQAPIVVNGDIVDIPGLIFTILGMPFAWISTAFNLTLFPGTPYSINIAYIFMGVIGLLIAIFIIRKLIK